MSEKIFSSWREALFLVTHPSLWFRKPLELTDFSADPFTQFETWYQAVQRQLGGEFSNWLCLSTLHPDGYPEGRIVLLKTYDSDGFVFYTNSHSAKGQSLEHHPKGAMTFYWERLQRQVRIVGDIQKVSDEEADRYFETRPRQSQLGAWASLQSSELSDRAELEGRLKEFDEEYAGEKIPRPPHWTGYRLKPSRFEFWELRLSRLHDRFLYERDDSRWTIRRLYP